MSVHFDATPSAFIKFNENRIAISQRRICLKVHCVMFGLIYDFYIGKSFHILPVNILINVDARSAIKVI